MVIKPIPVDRVLNSNLWKPSNTNLGISRDTNSWFNLNQMNHDKQISKVRWVHTKTITSECIRLYPTQTQKSILLDWNEVYRRVYNLTVSYMKTKTIMNFITLRSEIDMLILGNKELKELFNKCGMPKHTRDNAIKDCIKAYKTAYANLNAKNIKHFKLRYKKKTHHLSSIVIEPAAFSKVKNGFAIKTLDIMKSSKSLLGITKECRLCYNSRTGVFLLRVPYIREFYKLVRNSPVVSLDPGIRTFQTLYSPEGNCYEICSDKTNYKIKNLIKIISKKNDENPPKKKYIQRIRDKLKNMVKDMHCKVSNFLCKNFDNIVIGNMSTKSIISNTKKLHSSTKKMCLALSHYKFKLILQNTALKFGNKVHIVDESYTSKTCGNCGQTNSKLKGSKIFNCGDCGYVCDRDINAARNILLKNTDM